MDKNLRLALLGPSLNGRRLEREPGKARTGEFQDFLRGPLFQDRWELVGDQHHGNSSHKHLDQRDGDGVTHLTDRRENGGPGSLALVAR